MEFQKELDAGLNAVRQAAAVCRAVQSQISTASLEKNDRSPVTVADFASQALICRSLMEHFPDDPVIGEEGADDLRKPEGADFLKQIVGHCASVGVSATPDEVCDFIDRGNLQEYRPRFWTLDPIDGTKGFLRNDQYAISLSLIIDGTIRVGILGCPNMPVDLSNPEGPRGLLAWATAGGGAFLQPLDEPQSEPQLISVSQTSVTADAKFCESVESGHSSHSWSGQIASTLNITQEPFRIDSQCKYLAVAMGAADIYLRLPTKPGYVEKIWDHAGGAIVVQEAGGQISDVAGKEIEFQHGASLTNNKGIVVTNGQFHETVIDAVRQHSPSS